MNLRVSLLLAALPVAAVAFQPYATLSVEPKEVVLTESAEVTLRIYMPQPFQRNPSIHADFIPEGMKRQMKPVGRQNRADEYVVPGGIHLSLKRDVFLNRTVTRTVIHTENRDSSSGGGGTTVNSQGFSGHSGKF